MIRFRLYFDKDAETKYLNEMAQKGWAMRRFFAGFYSFEKCECGKYTYQVDFGNRLFSVSDEYREFMGDIGAEIVQTWGFWIILRKLAADGEFELYTDVDSSIEHYSKIRIMFKVAVIIEFICCLMELFAGMNGFYWGYALAFLFGAIIFVFINAVNKVNNIIAELRERKGEIADKRNRSVSPFLTCGLFLNSFALLIAESAPVFKIIAQIVAIILMVVGIMFDCKNRHI